MRVLYDARLAHRGLGIATFVVQLARALVATGEVDLVWLGDPALAPAGTSGFVRVDRRPYPLLDGPAGRALARRLRADLIHFTGNTGWTRRAPLPSVLTLHDLIFLDSGMRSRSPRQIVGHRYERLVVPRAASHADVLVVPSQTVAAQVQARIGPGRAPLVVHGGTPPVSAETQLVPAEIQPVPAETPPVSAEAQLAPADDAPPYLVAFAGRDPRKQTAAVVAAWRQLADLRLRLQLLAAGGMPPGLSASLQPVAVTGGVTIHPHLPRERIRSLLSGALALVYPSSDEGFGLPVLEGMAAGVPVLAGIAPVTREIGGDAIIALDPADPVGSIVAGVRRLLAEPALAAELSARGRARAARFTWAATASAYLDAYREAIRRRR